MNICLFSKEEISAKKIRACDERALHIKKILHKKTGDTFFAGEIEGAAGIATITKIGEADAADEGDIYFSFEPYSDKILAAGKPLFPLEMIVGFPRPIQLKRLLRDIAALGVGRVHLVGTETGEKSYLNATLSQNKEIQKMLFEGTVQAGGTHIPKSNVCKTLFDCLENFKNEAVFKNKSECVKIALDNENPVQSLFGFLKANFVQGKKVFCAIGSERGWSQNERGLLERHGFVRLGMGSRIMRTETCATAAAAIILNEMRCLE